MPVGLRSRAPSPTAPHFPSRKTRSDSLVPQFYCGTDLGAKLSFAAVGIPKFNLGTKTKCCERGSSAGCARHRLLRGASVSPVAGTVGTPEKNARLPNRRVMPLLRETVRRKRAEHRHSQLVYILHQGQQACPNIPTYHAERPIGRVAGRRMGTNMLRRRRARNQHKDLTRPYTFALLRAVRT